MRIEGATLIYASHVKLLGNARLDFDCLTLTGSSYFFSTVDAMWPYFKLSYFGEPTPEGGHILLYKIDKKMDVKAALAKLTDQCNICFSCGDKRKNTITPECGHKMCKECIIGK